MNYVGLIVDKFALENNYGACGRHVGIDHLEEAHAPAPQPLFLPGMARTIAGRRRDAVALPNWILPQLTQLVDAAPEGDQWLHEIKYDGYRMHARLERGRVKLLDPHRARLDA